MNATIVSNEKNVVKFTFQVGPEVLEEGCKVAYNKNKNKFAIPGFRKGKVPRKVIESQYGAEIFYDDALNYIISKEYDGVVKELGLDVVARPEVEVPVANKVDGAKFQVTVTIKPEVKLAQYKGLEVEKTDAKVEDEEVEAELKKVQEQNARIISVTDRAAKLGDIVNISYEGKIDGVAFVGGTSPSHDLTLGSHTFIDTFEDQIVGHSIGETFDVNVTFPAEYHDNEVAGKPAVFTVGIKEISEKELPELNDEFAQDVSDFDTMAEYKADILAKLTEVKERQAKDAKTDKLIEMIVKSAEMDIPEVMYEQRVDQLVNEFASNLSRQGVTMDMYLKYMGTTVDEFKKNFKDQAEKSVQARLVLEQIVKDENIEATKEEIDEKIIEIGKNYGLEGEKMLDLVGELEREGIAEDIRIHKALVIIEESAVEK